MMKRFVTEGRAYKLLREAHAGHVIEILRYRRAYDGCGLREAIAREARVLRDARRPTVLVVAFRIDLW